MFTFVCEVAINFLVGGITIQSLPVGLCWPVSDTVSDRIMMVSKLTDKIWAIWSPKQSVVHSVREFGTPDAYARRSRGTCLSVIQASCDLNHQQPIQRPRSPAK